MLNGKGGRRVDQVKIGAFIAQLRREKGWTQEELGERLGVTNKTVSRWENGNYMPSIELLTLMGREFEVSLNELLEGRRLDETDFRTAADERLASALRSPGERFRRWLERYGAFPAVTLVLCLLLAGCFIGMFQYRQAHPEDVRVPGTFACKDIVYHDRFTWIYFTFDRDGRYYIFDASGERFEHGSYTADANVVALDNGEAVRYAVIKGKQLRDAAPWGGELLTYEHIGEVPTYVNCDPEDFE